MHVSTVCSQCKNAERNLARQWPLPPPPDPPQIFEHVLLHIEIFGGNAGAKGAEIFVLPPDWVIFFPLRVYTQNTENFVENSKMGEKTKKD